ncbi:MAG: DedA family protein [Marmoricola sp.]
MGNLVDGILNLSPFWLLLVAGLLVFAEDAVFIGFLIPGETAAVLAGVATVIGRVPLSMAILTVVAAAIIGDSVGYEVGRSFFGPKLLRGKLLSRQRGRIAKAESFLRRRGGLAVFLGRFTAFLRAMMPALAGASRMRYRTFLLWNATGGIVWGTGFVVLGHVAGRSYHAVEKQVGHGVAIGLVVVVVGLVVVWRRSSERDEHEGHEENEENEEAG